MNSLLRRMLQRCFATIELPFERLFGAAFNPLAQLGALGYFFFWIVAVSGIYLFIFFDTGIERAYQSVESITREHWLHAGVMRSFHRYASDLMVVTAVMHLLREFAYDRYRGVRWFSWFTGLPIIWRCCMRRGSPATGWCGTGWRNMSLSYRRSCWTGCRSSASRSHATSCRRGR
ncbi:hypothetical protein ACVIJ6_003413 [Bradyrhizobium sp. USDA 4369]